jgi:hypothetical protein
VVAEIDRGMSSSPAGPALIHRWLTAAVDRAADGTDAEGRRRYTGSLHTLLGPHDLADPAPEPIATVVLVVDEAGDPARIELASLPGQPALELAFDISRIGEPVSIPLPDGRPGAVRGDVTVDQVRAAGISDPVELGALPENWVLYRIDLVPDFPGPGCSTLELAYSDVPLREDLENALRMEVHSAACPYTLGLTGEPITLGPFTGTVQEDFGGLTVEASDGATTIAIYTDMTLADLMAVGASLHPFDPAVGPSSLVAPPP